MSRFPELAGSPQTLVATLVTLTLIAGAANAGDDPGVFGAGRLHPAVELPAPVALPAFAVVESSDSSRLRDFGFALVEPDRATIRELAPFSSVLDIGWNHPELAELAVYARSYGLKLLLSLHSLFFFSGDPPGVPLPSWSLRPDYAERWAGFIESNLELLGPGIVWGFYLADEPFWNAISAADLIKADRAVKAAFPLIPTVSSMHRFDLEAAPGDLPEDVLDVVGYHAYAVPEDPNTDPEYQSGLQLLLEKFAGRDYLIVADAWWSEAQHGEAGFDHQTLIERAQQFRQVAESLGAVALGAFRWQSFAGGTGLRELPEELIRAYTAIGSEISGRCGVPGAVGPLAGETVLFFQDCRFYVTVTWRNPDTGAEGAAIARSLTRDTGMFWFFGPENIELTVKLLDGRAFNGHWWVFWSHMTTLEVTVEVTDTESGTVMTYTDPGADLSAFADP